MADGDLTIEFTSPLEFAKKKVASIQEYSQLAAQSVANLFRRPLYIADTMQQADLIGFGSLPIVLASVFFTGAALALNSATTLSRLAPRRLWDSWCPSASCGNWVPFWRD